MAPQTRRATEICDADVLKLSGDTLPGAGKDHIDADRDSALSKSALTSYKGEAPHGLGDDEDHGAADRSA
jgi:hypothetical protein